MIPRTPTDIFPDIDIPVISLVWNYAGLQPQEMEERITSNSERFVTTLVNDVEHIESQSLNGIAVVKIYLSADRQHSDGAGADDRDHADDLAARCRPARRRRWSPSTRPPRCRSSRSALTSDTLQRAGSSSTSATTSSGRSWPPCAAPRFPSRTAASSARFKSTSTPQALQSKGLSPVDIVNAVNAQNLILPTGTAKLGTLEYTVEMNGSPQTIAELNDLPVKTVNGATIYMREVAHIRDGFSPQTNIVRANGQRGVLMSATRPAAPRRWTWSNDLKATLNELRRLCPKA